MSLSANLVTPRQMRAIISPPGNHVSPGSTRREGIPIHKRKTPPLAEAFLANVSRILVYNVGVVLLSVNLARKMILLTGYFGFLSRRQRPAVRGAHATCFAIQARFLPLQV